jgi:sec-independent protein translocase protein TatA
MFGTLGFWEILLIIGIVAVLFGGKKLPQLGKGLGEGIMNFRNSLKKGSEDTKEEKEEKKSDNEKDN